MAHFRDPLKDKIKDASSIQEDEDCTRVCIVPECNSSLTFYKGPGNSKLCRDHQLKLREYGELARLDKLYSFVKKWSCDWCGYSPKTDPTFNTLPIEWDDEVHKVRGMRATLVADHIVRVADGGTDCADNVQTLCQNCNSKKTMLYKDYQRGKNVLIIEEVDTE